MTPISTSSNDRERSQEQLGFSSTQRVTTGVATINTKEPEMNTTNQIPATQNDAFMWSKLLCGVHGRGTADGLCQG